MEDASELEVLARLHQAAGTSNDSELAKRLGLSRQSVTKARATKSIPFKWIPKSVLLFDVTSDWLLFGRGQMRPGEADTPRVPAPIPANNCLRCTKLEAKLERVEAQRDELFAENRQLLRENGDLRAQVARLEERKNRLAIATGQPLEDSGAA